MSEGLLEQYNKAFLFFIAYTCNFTMLVYILCVSIKRLRNSFYLSISRDLRLRQYLGVRYDAIPNVFDWDLNMKLVEKGVCLYCPKYHS